MEAWNDVGNGPPVSRTELIARRRSETISQLQAQHDGIASMRPQFAPRLTGAEAAAALGYVRPFSDQTYESRTHMLVSRKAQMTKASAVAAGPDGAMAYAPTVASHLPPRTDEHGNPNMITSLMRPYLKNPSTAWVDKPQRSTRSELLQARQHDNVRTLQAVADRHATTGRPSVDERVQGRVAESVAYMQRAPPGKSRTEMLAERRRERVEEAEAAGPARRQEIALYSSQDMPFWQLRTDENPHGEYGGVASSGIGSHEEYAARQKWWAKPEVLSKIGKPPRAPEPFKLDAGNDKRFLNRKLSSGPKKAMRGYPPDVTALAEKLTNAPAPPVEPIPRMVKVGDEMKPRHTTRYTDAILMFRNSEKPPEPSLLLGDGLAMSAPLYSSFQKDGIFREPRLPKHIHDKADRPARAETAGPKRCTSPIRSGYVRNQTARGSMPENQRVTRASMRLGDVDFDLSYDTSTLDFGASLLASAGLPPGGLSTAPVPPEQRMSCLLAASFKTTEPMNARSIRSGCFASIGLQSRRPVTST